MEVVTCPNCGEENPAKFRLCGFCGTALAAATLPPQEVRKPATFIFVDLKGSTALTERIDQEAMNEIKKRYFTVMAGEIERHGGTIEKYIGDAIMAVFGIPRAHEDDALRAVRAANGMQRELGRLNEEFRRFYGVELANRTGVNTGEVVANVDPSANQQLATGDTVNVAARLEQAAPANEILIGETTYALVRGQVEVEAVEPLELKGKSERVAAFRLVSVGSDGAYSATSGDAPIVGRENELTVLEGALADATLARRCRLVTIVGDAGVGKSRLVREFIDVRAKDARTLRGRCLPYGNGITFWPINEITAMAAGITEEDTPEAARARIGALFAPDDSDRDPIAERVAAAIGLFPVQVPVTEIFWGIRRLLEHLAQERPLVVLIDDIHSAEATLLELLEHLIDAVEDAPILVVCTARNELLETTPDWAMRDGATRVELTPLGAGDAQAFIDGLLGERVLSASVRSRVIEASEGNPLFVEQMVSMLVDRGLGQRGGPDDGESAGSDPAGDIAIPPSIQALLAARLDNLSREERAVIEPASVIGLIFPEPAIEALAPDPIRANVVQFLGALSDKRFVQAAEAAPADDDAAYRFAHILIRDAAYGSLLKRARATFHERFVAWAEPVNRERGREQEFEEILGYHLEQAYRYRTELGPLDDEGRSVGRRAAEKLANAGRRAFGRGDMPAAANLLRRAATLLPADDPFRIELLPDLGDALRERGEFGEAVIVLDGALADAERIGDERLRARGRIARLLVDIYVGGTTTTAVQQSEDAMAVFQRAGDAAGLARAYLLQMTVFGTVGRYDDAAVAAEAVVAHATETGDRRFAGRGAVGYATSSLLGPIPVTEIIPRCERLLTETIDDRKTEAVIGGVLAQAYAMRGDFERARDRYRKSRAMLEDLGPSLIAAATSTESSRVEILAGDYVAAEAELRRDRDALEVMDERYFRSTITGLLAGVLIELGRDVEADTACREAESLTEEDDVNSEVLWRSARARLLAKAGSTDAALEHARRAIELADQTVDIDLQGDTLMTMGDVLVESGRTTDAASSYREAVRCYESKEDIVSASRARAKLETIDAN